MRRTRLALAGLVAAVLLLLACAGPALAHAVLIGSSPTQGQVLPIAPARMELHFSEPVSPLAVQLVDSDGTSRALDDFAVEGAIVLVKRPYLDRRRHPRRELARRLG
jgi:copper transport protein